MIIVGCDYVDTARNPYWRKVVLSWRLWVSGCVPVWRPAQLGRTSHSSLVFASCQTTPRLAQRQHCTDIVPSIDSILVWNHDKVRRCDAVIACRLPSGMNVDKTCE